MLISAAAKSLQSCPTLCDPHRRQPTRLPCPWDSPGKNTGVGCHFLLQCMKVESESEVAVVSDPQQLHELQPSRLLLPWDFPGKSNGVGCHCLGRVQFPTSDWLKATLHPADLSLGWHTSWLLVSSERDKSASKRGSQQDRSHSLKT